MKVGEMASSSIEVQLGHLAGQQDMILKELGHAREDRKQQFTTIDEIRGSTLVLGERMTKVEQTLTQFTPTINEFIAIKQKVIGAGKLGKWLWVIFAGVIGLAFKFRLEIASWFAK